MESAPGKSPAALSVESVRALNLSGRDFLKELDFTPLELTSLLDLSSRLKIARLTKTEPQLLVGKNLAAIFEKTSTRTRIAFDVAMLRDERSVFLNFFLSAVPPSSS